MKVYESSSATLRAVLAHPLLQRDKVDETMEELASANADAKDIDETIRIGIDVAQGETVVDDAELEAELNRLVNEGENEKTKAEQRKKEADDRVAAELQRRLEALALTIPPTPPTQSPVPPYAEPKIATQEGA